MNLHHRLKTGSLLYLTTIISVLVSLILVLRVIIQKDSDLSSRMKIEIRPTSEFRFADIPIYYINLPKYTDRDQAMRAKLRGAGSLVRINAIDGTDLEEIKRYFDPGITGSPAFEADPAQYLYDNRTCVLGQLGNYLSHLLAITAAHAANHDYAITMEDDYSEVYGGLWPITDILDVIDSANRDYPGWFAIRLQWHDYPANVEQLHSNWIENIMMLNRPQKTSFPLLQPYKGGWGNMVTLWSRAGLSEFIKMYTSSRFAEKFICLEERPCAADLSFWTHDKILVTTPPLVGPNVIGAGTTEIRRGVGGADHTENHRKAAAAQLLWLAEALEILGGTQINTNSIKKIVF